MDTKNWKIHEILAKLFLSMSLAAVTDSGMAKPVETLESIDDSITSSEIESYPSPQTTDSIDVISDQQFKLRSIEKKEQISNTSQEQDKLDFSDTGRAGQQTAGEARGQCGDTEFPLTALVPVSNWGKTVQEYPSFWFYLPAYYGSATQVEFVLQDKDRNNISQENLSTEGNSDYLYASLPQDRPGLKVGEWYRWYLKVFCDQQKRYPPKVVYGWIRRVPIDSHLRSQLTNNQYPLYEVYGKAGIWFDAIDSLLQTPSIKKTSLYFQKGWQQLITAKGVDLDLPQPKCSDFPLGVRY